MHESDETYKLSVGQPEGKRLLGSSRYRCINVKIILKLICNRVEVVGWIHLA
jgi:hypothetical protein